MHQRGGSITCLRRKLFVTQCRKILLGNTSVYQKISSIENFYASERGGGITFSIQNFLSHSTQKFRWGTLRCFREFRVSQNFIHEKRISLNSVENFLSHSAEKFREGILLFLRKFLVSKSFMDEKGVSRFSVEYFWSHSSEKFRGHPFNVSENLGYRKNLCIIGGGGSRFSVQHFWSHSAEKFRGHPFNLSENLGYRKILCIIGVSQFSVENFLSHSAEKLRKGTL